MSLSTQPYKGARDFYPEDKRFQKYLFNIMREAAEKYGYEEYDAPILEPTDLYLSKGNEEIIQEQTYTFTDRGDRSVTIRTEMTPTVSRMVAGKRQELSYPLRWYSIPNLWRYERPQRGRLREFWQLNVDVFGVAGVAAELEVIQVADSILKSYGAKSDMYSIKLNSRPLVDTLLKDYLLLGEVESQTLVRLIDRMHKMEQGAFMAQVDAALTPNQREANLTDRIVKLLTTKRIQDLPDIAKQSPAALELMQLAELLDEAGVHNAVFDITLMRGFDYYTGIVFEVFDTAPENNRSMFGGGRYDGLVAMFGVEPVPTVGFGMGDVPLQNFLESHNLMPNLAPETDVYMILIGDNLLGTSQKVLKDLRNLGISVALDTTGRKIDKQIKSAVRKNIPYVMFVGESELTSGQFRIKDLASGIEESHGIERLVSIVKDRRRKTQQASKPKNNAKELDDLDLDEI